MQEKILALLRKKTYRPMGADELAAALNLTGGELAEFWSALQSLLDNAVVIKNRSGLLGLPADMNLAVGTLSMTSKGYGFVIPDNKQPEDGDVFVPGGYLGTAMNGDRVVARLSRSKIAGRSLEGEIIRVVTRANERIVGTFEASGQFGFVTPDDKKIGQDIFIPKGKNRKAKSGQKVVALITKWPDGRRSAEGEIVEILGRPDEPGVDVLSVMRQFDLPQDFPADAASQAAKLPQAVRPEEIANRLDRRDFPAVTIDGDDSKDFDDAVYAEKRGRGWFLGVYIADVSHYVTENSPLDLAARERGTSVYLVDRVIPMLPFELSNGICSLNEGEDRLAMACEMEIAADGAVKDYKIVPAVIRSRHRMTYGEVNKILLDGAPEIVARYADVVPMLKVLAKLRDKLKDRRQQRGAINFDLPEVKVKLDENNHPVELVRRAGSLSESIIEECMLIANETVARHMAVKNQPCVYRVHEQPKQEKIVALNALLATFGLHINVAEDGLIAPGDVAKVLARAAGAPEEKIISTVALRSMQQARYADSCLGHFGLAARYYTHFTSPIRRYPDLIVHRLLRETLPTGEISTKRQEKLALLLPDIAAHSSTRERTATEAERETAELKIVEYMQRFVGESFSGVVSGVTAFGMFVELANGAEGLVRLSRMLDDYYEYVEEKYALIGERTNRVYRLGDPVEVTVLRADPAERAIDFVLKEDGGAAKAKRPAAQKSPAESKPVRPPKPAKPGKPPKRAKRGDKNKPKSKQKRK